MAIQMDINTLRILLALLMLSMASVLDVRKREVNDMLWIAFGGISVLLIFFEPNIWLTLKNIGIAMIIAPIVIVIWRIGLFGGADAFALIVLAGLAPHANIYGNAVTPLSTLTNAIMVSVIPIFVNLSRNLIAISRHQDIFTGFDESRSRKIMAMFIGYRTKNPKHSFSIERKDVARRFDFSLHHAENTPFCNTSDTWVTPGIPYILYIMAGFVIQLVYGDIIFNAIRIFY